jgi:methionine-S-sulfoxide reductase
MALATFAAGCFWGIEAQFRQLEGVLSTRVGYMGGHIENPNYKLVCTGTTGHAEVVEITFDPDIISFAHLLDHFWKVHNPTTLDRQGPDIGSQYRSVIFSHDAAQQNGAERSKQALTEAQYYPDPIVTEIIEVDTFWPAEEYHQCYLEKKGLGSCH